MKKNKIGAIPIDGRIILIIIILILTFLYIRSFST